MHAKDLYDRLVAGYNYDPMYGELCNERDRLKIKNAKLRELVRDMWDVALHPETFGDGSYLLRRMRELGVKVDE